MKILISILSLVLISQAQFLNQGNMSIFRVGSKNFTHQDIDQVVKQYADAKASQSGKPLNQSEINQLKLMIADQMISMELIKLEAKNMGISVSNKSVDSLYKSYKSQFPNAKSFQSFLKGNGLNEGKLKEKLREQILPQKVMTKVITVDRSMPTEKQIRAFFDANRNKFPVNDSLMAARIFLKSTGADAKTLLDGFAAQIRMKKAPFQMLAAQFSDDPNAKKTGGMLPAFKRNEYGPDCANALKGLNAGSLSRVCVGRGGSNLFMVIAANDGRYESYRERAAQGVMMSRQEKYMEQFKEFGMALRKKYGVQFYDASYDPSAAPMDPKSKDLLGNSGFNLLGGR